MDQVSLMSRRPFEFIGGERDRQLQPAMMIIIIIAGQLWSETKIGERVLFIGTQFSIL
jgi:hypothetical protein